jgi:hypothetical protein
MTDDSEVDLKYGDLIAARTALLKAMARKDPTFSQTATNAIIDDVADYRRWNNTSYLAEGPTPDAHVSRITAARDEGIALALTPWVRERYSNDASLQRKALALSEARAAFSEFIAPSFPDAHIRNEYDAIRSQATSLTAQRLTETQTEALPGSRYSFFLPSATPQPIFSTIAISMAF